MWLVDKVTEIFDYHNAESDEIGESFISKQYFGLLRISGLYTRFDRGGRLYSMLHVFFIVSVLLTHIHILLKPSFKLMSISFVIFGQSIHFFLLMLLVLILVPFVQFRHKEIFSFHRAMALNFFDYSEPFEGAAGRLEEEVRRERRLLIPIPVSVALAASSVFLISPVADQYGSFDFNKTADMVNDNLPFRYGEYLYSTQDTFGFYISLLFQLFIGFSLVSFIGTGGFTYIVMSQGLSVQIKILLDSLDNIETRASNLLIEMFGTKCTLPKYKMYYHEEFSYCYNICLKKNLQHHQIILRYFNIWTRIFSVPVFLSYITGTIVIALSLLSVSSWVELPGTTVTSLLLCIGEVGYMFLFSLYSQRITDLNEELRFKMYCIKWYYCDAGVRRSLRIFQEMAIRPMTLVACGIIPANMDTFAKVMNSAYSYYNLATAFNVA